MKQVLLAIAMLAIFPLVAFADMGERDDEGQPFLAFGSMYGVDGPFVNSAAIRGVLGDELPWQVKSAHGLLTTDGRLHITVRGLVFTSDPEVPANLRGINDEATFRGLVSCLSESAAGALTTVNVATSGFAATRSGNSEINARITLPDPCVAPIVFVLSGSEDKWFAVIGHER